tara:strand:+ start:1232 stop:1393 length:162 start_codon:yes stop_codon:yes gene_type:complete
MKKIFFIILFFLTSCSSAVIKNDINFSENLTFEEFKIKLDEYSKNNLYPNIDF